MSIRTRFMMLIALLSLVASLALAFISYQFNVKNAYNEAKAKGTLVSNYVKSSRDFFETHQRPAVFETIDQDKFIPELMSSFAVIRGVLDSFSETTPDYAVKHASTNPLVATNKADEQELELIKQFKDNPHLTMIEDTIEKNGKAYYYLARPIPVIDESCLGCHGDPQDVPEELREIYGDQSGYNWEVGDIISTLIVYIPLQADLNEAKRLSVILFLIGAIGILALMLIIWIFFNHFIARPLLMLEQRATEISLGKNLADPIKMQGKDEIGTLGRAIDRLRISVNKLMERYM